MVPESLISEELTTPEPTVVTVGNETEHTLFEPSMPLSVAVRE